MLLYNIGIWLYAAAVKIAALFNPKARLMIKGHRGVFRRLSQELPPSGRTIWVHCASLGEFEQGRPVIEALRIKYPSHKILLTFFSPSGYEVRKNYEGADFILYLPFDTPRNARRFVRSVKPEFTVFIKYEYWLNYLRQLRRGGFRTFIVSAIFRRDSVFFKSHGSLFRRALGTFERLFVQDEASAGLLDSIGVDNVTVAGDTRFDRVAAIAASAKDIPLLERIRDGADVFVAGSTWPPDEDLIQKLIAAHPDIRFVIAPHEIDRERIGRFIAECAAPVVRYTEYRDGDDLDGVRVVMLDTVGLLSSAYRYGKYAYIGGGFGVGIHNTLEAATFGLPIAFGPNYSKFREARDLISIGTACSVNDFAELDAWLSPLHDDPVLYSGTKTTALDYIARNTGATARFVDYLGGTRDNS